MPEYQSYGLIGGFLRSCDCFSLRPALVVDNCTYTYSQLGNLVKNLSVTILNYEQKYSPFVAVFAAGSLTAYAGILGVLAAGRGYLPLNPKFPIERTLRMMSLSGVNTLIIGKEAFDSLETILSLYKTPLTIISPDESDFGDLSRKYTHHRFVTKDDLGQLSNNVFIPQRTDMDKIAYLLFTSGSTGNPKGVPVSHENVLAYVNYMADRNDVNENDKFAHTCDLTFDLSIHGMFVCWERGACLCCLPECDRMAPAQFIKDLQITMWISVPSVLMFMDRLKLLKPNTFPSIRCSLFCGEPLLATLAAKWQQAAPNSIVQNIYGPTEATVAISHYIWDNELSPAESFNGIVPIGWIFTTQEGCIIDSNRNILDIGEPGELCLSGTQVTKGYFNDRDRTREQYIYLSNDDEKLWYRTGDLIKQDKNGCMYYIGRIDNQVQVLGHRVELQEIDHILRQAAETQLAISIAWPLNEGRAEGIYAFVHEDSIIDSQSILSECRKRLPDYMVPRKVFMMNELPMNSNGKIDRKKLMKRMEELI